MPPPQATFDAAMDIRAQLRFLPVLVEFSRLFFEASLPTPVDGQLIYALQLAVSEACTNVVKHGYYPDSKYLRLELAFDGDTIVIRLRDQGIPFDPNTAAEPDLDNPTGHGLGVFFLRRLMDSIEYLRLDDTNILTLTRRLP